MRTRKKDWNETLFTFTTLTMGMLMLMAAFGPHGADLGEGRVYLILGGIGGVVAAGRHGVAAVIRGLLWLWRRR